MPTLNRKAGAAGTVCTVGTIIAIVLASGQVGTTQRGLELIGNAESCRRELYTCFFLVFGVSFFIVRSLASDLDLDVTG